MKLYVATAWDCKDQAKSVMEEARARGHVITYNWTVTSDEADWVSESVLELEAVSRADALVIIPKNHGTGHYAELGMALALSKPVVSLGTSYRSDLPCIFLAHPLVRHAPTLAEALAYLEEL